MNHVRNSLSALSAAIKTLAIASACALVIFSSVTPALAFGGSSSKPSTGLEQLDKVQQKSEQAISSDAKSAENSGRSVMKNASEGLNGVQGKANKNEMISPSEAQGKTIEGSIKEALEEVKK